MQDSFTFLKKDKHLKAIIKKHGELSAHWGEGRPSEPFASLVRSIVYQQLSGKAAETIYQRFLKLFPAKKFPKPEEVLKMSPVKMRGAGLSRAKILYIKDLAKHFVEKKIDHKKFPKMTDEEIIEHLVAVKGIGVWTVHMFLMFTLRRPDVLPTGDLGIRKGFQRLFGLQELPTPKQMEKLAESWKGHRTLACLYLWKIVDTE